MRRLDRDYEPVVNYDENPAESTEGLAIYTTETSEGWFVGVVPPDGNPILDGAGPYKLKEYAIDAGRLYASGWETVPCSKS